MEDWGALERRADPPVVVVERWGTTVESRGARRGGLGAGLVELPLLVGLDVIEFNPKTTQPFVWGNQRNPWGWRRGPPCGLPEGTGSPGHGGAPG